MSSNPENVYKDKLLSYIKVESKKMNALMTLKTYKMNFVPIFLNSGETIMKKGKNYEKNYYLPKNWTKMDIEEGNLQAFTQVQKQNPCYAVRTGEISGVIGVDIDVYAEYPDDEVYKLCKESNTLEINTPNNGKHYIYKYTNEIKSATGINNHIDIRTDGHSLYAAGTRTTNGVYEIANNTEPVEMPNNLKTLLKSLIEAKSPRKVITTNTSNITQKKMTFTEFKKLMSQLDIKYCENYNDWTMIGWACSNVARNNDYLDEGYELWIEYSQKCEEKFCEKKCYEIYYNNRESGVGYTTLKSMSIEDKNELNELDQKLLQAINNPTQAFMATIVKILIENDDNNIVYDNKTETYFSVSKKTNIWYEDKNADCVRQLISYKLPMIFGELCVKLHKQAIDKEDDNEKAGILEKTKLLFKTITIIQGDGFVKGVINFVRGLIKEDDFYQTKIDNKRNVFAFKNGVLYDFKLRKIRNIEVDDYVLTTTGYDYNDKVCMDKVAEMKQFYQDILTEEEIRNYFLENIALSMYGKNVNQKITFITGTGANGKSLAFDGIKKVWGDYQFTFNPEVLTKAKKSANETSELSCCKGKRLAYSTEPEEDCVNNRIQVGALKNITGEDSIKVRALYKNAIDVMVQFTPFILCNDKPLLSKVDGGASRRINIIEFNSKFVEEPNPKRPNQKKIDITLGEKFENPEYRDALLYILLNIWNTKDILNSIKVPASVAEASKEYCDSSNDVKIWIDENYVKTQDEKDYQLCKTLYTLFKAQTKSTMSDKAFSSRMEDLGITKKKISTMRYICIRQKTEEDREEDNQ